MYYENIFVGNNAKSTLRLMQFILNWWRTIPSQVAYLLSTSFQKQLVMSDFGNYGNMVRTLVFAKHNRNLFYHRMGRTSIFYSWILSEEKSLKLPFSCTLGRHAHFVHNDSCHLNASSIGDDFVCYPHVIIGSKRLDDESKPILGNKVTLGSGAVVVGGIRIGNNVSVGANTVVIKDIPDNCIVYGNPCIVKKGTEK